jgi:apolipoprotein N-acyltransferase
MIPRQALNQLLTQPRFLQSLMLFQTPVKSLAFALLAGLAQAASIAAPWSGQPQWWLQLIAMATLVWLLNRSGSVKQAALLGWVFSTSWLCGTVWWLFISMHVYGGLAAPLAALAVFALCGFLSLYYAIAAGIYKHFWQFARMGSAWSAIIFAALWLLAELCRDTLFTGFPWGAAGYAHVDGPLSHMAFWIGAYGIGWLAAFMSAWLIGLVDKSRQPASVASRSAWFWVSRLGASSAVALALACLAFISSTDAHSVYGFMTHTHLVLRPTEVKIPGPEHVRRESVALLQGNIPQGEKFEPSTGIQESLSWYSEKIKLSTATLVITPETAIPLLPRQLPEGYEAQLRSRIAQSPISPAGPQAALIGIPLGSHDEGYTNSVIGLAPSTALDTAKTYTYSKHHLVPFGEFIPRFFKWFTQMMNIPLGDFNRGALGQPSFEWAGQRWAPNICYEDLFGNELARNFRNEASAPTVMVNVSNIGWFGNTVAIDQHLHISRMRALELGRPMIRATNTGATVIINHRGEVTHSLPRHTKGVLVGEVEGRSGITPFAWWASRFGLWPLWILGITIVLIAAYRDRMRANP